MTDRRTESRYLCADMARLDYTRGEDEIVSLEAVLEDISSPGSCVQVEEPVPLGVSVTLSIGDRQFHGQVCHCHHRDDAYFIGMEFVGEKWSTSLVEPKHLLNPNVGQALQPLG